MSGEAKFTPGPWKWRWKSASLHRVGERPYAFGETVFYPRWEYDSGVTLDISEANAHLIAASPELYAALEAAQIMMVAAYMDAEKAGDTEFMQRLNANNEAAKAALAKARGESQ